MNFFIEKKSFYESLNHFQSVVEKRNTIPILGNVKILASDDFVQITATDLSIQLTDKINAKVVEKNKSVFEKKTNDVFNNEFKGFDFKVGEKKFRYKVSNPFQVADNQDDVGLETINHYKDIQEL